VRLGPRGDDLSDSIEGARAEADAASRGSAIKLGAEAAGRALALATTVVIGRSLAVSEFGLFGVVSAAAIVAAEVADFGLQATAGRELVARGFSIAALVRAKATLGAFFAAALGIAAALAAADLLPTEARSRLVLFAPLALYFALASWTEVLGVTLRARGHRLEEALTILCFRATLLLFAGAALGFHTGLHGLVWAHAASPLPALALSGWLVARVASGDPVRDPPLSVPRLLRRALPLGANGVLSLLSVRIELFVLGLWATERAAGLFNSALNLVLPLLVVPSAICAGAMPALTREALRREGPVRARTSLTLALLAAPAAVGLALVPGVVGMLFGGKYADAAPTLRVLSLVVPVVFMNALLLHALIAVGHAARVARLTAVRTVIAAAAAVVLIPRAGATGAALGFFAAETALLVLARAACAQAGFPVSVIRPLGLGLLASLPMAVVLALLRLPEPAAVAAGVAVYAVTLGIALRWKGVRNAAASG
jgi:O-antigen/teichoic acid export membrane protein